MSCVLWLPLASILFFFHTTTLANSGKISDLLDISPPENRGVAQRNFDDFRGGGSFKYSRVIRSAERTVEQLAEELVSDSDGYLTLEQARKIANKRLAAKAAAQSSIRECEIYPDLPVSKTAVNKSLQQIVEDESVIAESDEEGILVMGNTGSGKTTLIQMIAGDLRKIHLMKTAGGVPVIVDDERRIGGPSTQSKTLYPERIVDPNTTTVFYDLPGFSDTRGTDTEIAATFFVKKVIKNLKRVKMFFLVPSVSVTFGQERLDLERLLNHAVKQVKNVDKYRNAMALVVTKVKSFSDLYPPTYLSDNDILKSVVNFLEARRNFEQALLSSPEVSDNEKSIAQKRWQILDIFLTKDENQKSIRIGISRSPELCGPFSEIASVGETRRKLTDFYSNLEYVEKNNDDFGYTLQEKSLLDINDQVENITAKVEQLNNNLTKEFRNSYNIKIRNKFVEEVYYNLETDVRKIGEMVTQLKSNSSLQMFSNLVPEYFNKIGISSVSKKYISRMRNKGDLLDFFESITGKQFPRSQKLMAPFDQLSTQFSNLKSVYGFLMNFDNKLSDYSVHIDSRTNAWTANKNLKVNLDHLEILNSTYAVDYINNIKMSAGPIEINYLDRVVNFTVKTALTIHCDQKLGKISIRGNYVKFSDFLFSGEFTRPEILNLNSNLKSVEIMAKSTIFVDEDIIAIGRQISVVLIAPKWVIVGNRHINLNGTDGIPNPKLQADAGSCVGCNGVAGKPGEPGGSAGHIFGMASEIINGEKLVISLNGGRGGPGQQGGNGAEGRQGKNASFTDFPWCGNLYQWPDIRRHYTTVSNRGFFFSDAKYHSYKGEKGGTGGEGGNGGAGGLGGNKGKHLFIFFGTQKSIKLQISAKEGKIGNEEGGGDGGQGGVDGETSTAQYGDNSGSFSSANGLSRCYWFDKKQHSVSTRGQEGSRGVTGGNAKERSGPKKVDIPFKEYEIINDFRLFIIQRHVNPIRGPATIQMQLDGNNQVEGLSNTEALADELLKYEKYIFTVENKELLQKSYDSLLKRIESFASNPNKAENGVLQYKKVLRMLYATALSRICSLSQDGKASVIIDIDGYLDVVKESISKLKSAHKRIVINEYSVRFQSEFDKKINEGLNYVASTVIPAIADIEEEVNGQFVKLTIEIADLKKDVQDQKHELMKKKRQLESTMGIRSLLSIFKVVDQIASFFGPQGATIGGAINAISSVAESFLPNTNINPGSLRIPPGVGNSLAKIEKGLSDKKMKKIGVLSAQIDEMAKEISQNEEMLSDLKVELNKSSKVIQELKKDNKSNSDTMAELQKLEKAQKSLKSIIKEKQAKIEGQVNKAQNLNSAQQALNAKVKKAAKGLARVTNAINVAEASLEVYNTIKNDGDSIEELSKLIKEAEIKHKELQQFEDKVQNEMIPVMEGMSADLTDVIKNLGGSSRITLLIQKWRVQGRIKEMKVEIKQVTEGFKMQDNFQVVMDKMMVGMDLIINIYDQIEKYEQSKKLADFIVNINSAESQQIAVTEPALVSKISELELRLQSNVILIQHEVTMHAFKQRVFPFAKFYLQEFNLPSTLALFSDNSEMADFYADKITKISSKLKEYKTKIDKQQDLYTKETQFSNQYISSQPFYVWKNSNWRGAIRDILAGKKISLNADIKNSIVNKDAIKFSLIEIHFNARNAELQKELDTVLNEYSVTMEHSGISHYRFQNKYFLMHGSDLTLEYNFETDLNGSRLNTNGVYKKLVKGDYVVSPYTMWNLQIKKAKQTSHSNNNDDFSKLERFADWVDVELVGKGTYVDTAAYSLTDMQVDDYYHVDNTIL